MEELETLLQTLVTKETAILQMEKDVTGIEINVQEMNKNLKAVHKNAKSTEEEKSAAESAYATEQEKLKVALADLAKLEVDVVRLRRRKRELMETIKTEENLARRSDPIYDVPAGGGTNERSQMQGSIISQLPEFNGSFGSDAESFIKLIDRTKDQFSWASKATAQMVRSKLTGAARMFVDNQEKEMIPGIEDWDGVVPGGVNLRQMLLEKFALPVSAVAATNAIEDLKQENHETVDSFYERTRFAVDKLLFNVPKETLEEKTNYRRLFGTQVFIFFKAGLLLIYRTKIFSAAQAQIPTDARSLLEAARNAEREANPTKPKNLFPKAVHEIEIEKTSKEGDLSADGSQTSSISASVELEDLSRQLNAIQEQLKQRGRGRGGFPRRQFRGGRYRGFRGGRGGGQQNQRGGRGRGGFQRGKGRGRCFICDDESHWADKCPKRGQAAQGAQGDVWAVDDNQEDEEEFEDEDYYLNE